MAQIKREDHYNLYLKQYNLTLLWLGKHPNLRKNPYYSTDLNLVELVIDNTEGLECPISNVNIYCEDFQPNINITRNSNMIKYKGQCENCRHFENITKYGCELDKTRYDSWNKFKKDWRDIDVFK